MKKLTHILAVTFVLAGVAGCGQRPGSGDGSKSKTVTIKGSDTMVILGQRWAETYMQRNPGATVQVTGGGSGTGIAALINGGTDICQSSRPMKDKEKEQARARHKKEVKETPVALDGVAIYVHKSCPIKSLTKAQLKDIYTGKITNWRDVGWQNAPIVAYSRENSSGTYVFFKEHVLDNEDFARDVQTLPGTAAVVNATSKDPRSIGYGGIAYGTGIRAVPIAPEAGGEPVAATLENVKSNRYPLSRQLFFYTIGEPDGEVKAFIDWVLNDEGQRICEQVGFYPLTKK